MYQSAEGLEQQRRDQQQPRVSTRPVSAPTIGITTSVASPPEGQRQPGIGRGVAEHLLQHLRDQLCRAEQDEAGRHHEPAA